MPSLTLELTEEAYQNAISLPATERDRIGNDAFSTARNVPGLTSMEQNATSISINPLPTFADHKPGEPFPDLLGLPAEHIAAIAEGIADHDAGRVQDGWEVLAELKKQRKSRTGIFARQG